MSHYTTVLIYQWGAALVVSAYTLTCVWLLLPEEVELAVMPWKAGELVNCHPAEEGSR